MIKKYLSIVAILLLNPVFSHANENTDEAAKVELTVYKTKLCGCCKKWVNHLENEGVIAHSIDHENIGFIKAKYKIAPNYRSCHTAVTKSGFAFEGHVPAKFIRQFLEEKHLNAIGLSVPAMPVGSPGMEVANRFMPYNVLILFNDGTSKVYKHIGTYEEQF